MRFILASCIFLLLTGISSAVELTIGLIPEQNVFKQVERYQPIGEYIEKKTGMNIKFTILSRYGNIIESFKKEKMDGAFWGSFTGALAIGQLNIEHIVRPLWHDGTSAYHGFIFVRKDSGISNVADMRGKSIVFVERATTAGYLFPMAYFKEHNVKNIDTYFKEYYFAGSHDAAIQAVVEKEADIGCAKNTIYKLLAEKDPRIKNKLIVLARSPNVPSNGLGIRHDLDPAIKKKLMDVFLGMDNDPEGKAVLKKFGAQRFIATSKHDYNSVFDLAKKAGIDIRKYQYINK